MWVGGFTSLGQVSQINPFFLGGSGFPNPRACLFHMWHDSFQEEKKKDEKKKDDDNKKWKLSDRHNKVYFQKSQYKWWKHLQSSTE